VPFEAAIDSESTPQAIEMPKGRATQTVEPRDGVWPQVMLDGQAVESHGWSLPGRVEPRHPPRRRQSKHVACPRVPSMPARTRRAQRDEALETLGLEKVSASLTAALWPPCLTRPRSLSSVCLA
jgi:hypothetical protein